jgi:hypothetical protein
VWTGIEYQMATQLIYEGFVEEGLTVVRTTRAATPGSSAVRGTTSRWATTTPGRWRPGVC